MVDAKKYDEKDRKSADEKGGKWITVQGRKIQISGGEDIKDKLPSDLRGEKGQNTKRALRKSDIVKRFHLQKSKFNFRDEVLYDDLQKSGLIGGFDGDYVKIFNNGRSVVRFKNDVFKKSEFIGDTHWDVDTINNRHDILSKAGISQNYLRHDWADIPALIQDKIQKNGTPAGTGITTNSEGVWNPVNTDTTVDTKLKESKEKKDEKK